MTNVRRRLILYGLDINVIPNKTTKGISPINKKDPTSYLRIYETEWQCRAYQLKAGLLAIGRSYQCEHCKITDSWNGKELKLQIDHINRDRKNCLEHNLRFLCPNCHSQTETYGRVARADDGAGLENQ